MLQRGKRSLKRTLTTISGAVAAATVVVIFLVYVLTAYEYEQERLDSRAEFAAAEVSRLIYVWPDTWKYQDKRLSELLSTIRLTTSPVEPPLYLRILDTEHRVIAEVGAPLPPPNMTAVRVVRDAAGPAGRVELTEGVRHIWLHAIPVGFVGFALAISMFLVLQVLPLRALLNREKALEAARQETRESEQQLRLVSDAMPVLIGYVDADLRLRVINKTGETWYARPRSEILGRPVRELLSSELCEQIHPNMARALSGETVSFEHMATYPDNIARRIRGQYMPHEGPDGRVQGFFALVEDVTAQHEIESQLRQAQKTEALGQLTGGVAHDFNNLLGIVLGNIEMLRDIHTDDPPALALADAALNACLRGGELTQRLLAFARKQTLAPRVLVVNDLVANTVALLRRTIASSIHIETVLAEELWPCSVDAGQLENAIVNLGINARDAMPGGGKLTIETANFETDRDPAHKDLDGLSPGSYVAITVSDSGTGMSPEVLARVFEPFFTTKDVGKGSGLGLSMVYGFAKQSGGQVKIYSEIGEGTSVRIYLPKTKTTEEHATDTSLNAADIPTGRGETVLVVEDAEDLRAIAVAHLRGLGYTVLQASEGQAALAILNDRPDIDLLFTDVILPDGLHGGELARQAKACRPNLKVLFASGYARNAVLHQGRLEKGAQLLNKPYRKQDLARQVRAALDQPAGALASA